MEEYECLQDGRLVKEVDRRDGISRRTAKGTDRHDGISRRTAKGMK